MADKQQERIIDLQRQLKVAKEALNAVARGCRDPEMVASSALYAMMPLENKTPLQVLVGHERRPR